MKFRRKIWRGNKMGAGFISLPKDVPYFAHGESVKVKVLGRSITFFTRISTYKNYLGVYVPKELCQNYELIGKKVYISIERVNGFPSKVTKDGRIYLPPTLMNKLKIKKGDLILIEGRIDGKKIRKICKVCVRRKKAYTEYSCTFHQHCKHKKGIFYVSKLKKPRLSRILKLIVGKRAYCKVNKGILTFFTPKTPVVLPLNINLNEKLVYYMGCYFADGTKRGSCWGIVASTFEQGNFYLKMHRSIVLNSELHTYLSISIKKHKSERKIKKMWERRCNTVIESVRLRRSKESSLKTHEYGSLVIRGYNLSVQRVYNKLLEIIVKEIVKRKDRKLAIEFLLGVLEGDGSPQSGEIRISTNLNDVKILEKILKISGLEFRIIGKKRIYIRISYLEILKNLPILWNKIFKFYPKRRKKFIERFLNNVGAVRFLLGKQNYCSSWVKAWLTQNNILDENYKLTEKGKKIRKCLLKLQKEMVE